MQPVQSALDAHPGLVRVRDRSGGQVFLDLSLETLQPPMGTLEIGRPNSESVASASRLAGRC